MFYYLNIYWRVNALVQQPVHCQLYLENPCHNSPKIKLVITFKRWKCEKKQVLMASKQPRSQLLLPGTQFSEGGEDPIQKNSYNSD